MHFKNHSGQMIHTLPIKILKKCRTEALGLLLFAVVLSCKDQTLKSPSSQEASVVTDVPPNSNSTHPNSTLPGPTTNQQSNDPRASKKSVLTNEPPEFRTFDFPAPSSRSIKKQIQIWATYYYVPQVIASPRNTNALTSKSNTSLLGSDMISRQDWCALSLQGSGQVVLSEGKSVVVNFDDRSSQKAVDCSEFIKSPGVSDKIKNNTFKLVGSIYGEGSRVQEMIPFRTLAVDPKFIPYGSLVYFPEARGASVEFPGGIKKIHDGYFIAGDTGSAILGSHVDVFVGNLYKQPFSFVQSNSSSKFGAQIIDDSEILNRLKSMSKYK